MLFQVYADAKPTPIGQASPSDSSQLPHSDSGSSSTVTKSLPNKYGEMHLL